MERKADNDNNDVSVPDPSIALADAAKAMGLDETVMFQRMAVILAARNGLIT